MSLPPDRAALHQVALPAACPNDGPSVGGTVERP